MIFIRASSKLQWFERMLAKLGHEPSMYGAFAAIEEFLEGSEGKKFVKIFLGTQYFLIRTDV